MEFEIENTLLFTLVPLKIKYLSINLRKYVQDLHKENCKTLVKEIKKELNQCTDFPFHEKLNIVRMSVLSNLIHRFNTTAIKTPTSYFVDVHKLILRFI